MHARLKAYLVPFLILTALVVVLQYFILRPHLRYGFADVDWMFLLTFKELGVLYHDPISHIIHAWERWGVYTYQVYYIGLIEHFFGFDYRIFNIVAHVFKVIATLSIFPLILITTKNRLAAFLTTLIYAASYSSVGVMYTVVTSGLYVAIPFMSLFLIWYWKIMNKSKNTFLDIIIAVVLFFTTLVLSTERMYPLIPTVVLIEFFWWLRQGFTKVILFQGLKRLSVLFVLFLTFFLYKPSTFTLLLGNTEVTYQKFVLGNWQIVLTPFISLGSLFLPDRSYWKIFGTSDISNIYSYLGFLLSGPIAIFSIVTLLLSCFLSKRPLKFLLKILFLALLFSFLAYFLAHHQLYIQESIRNYFDPIYLAPALTGIFLIIFIIGLTVEWLRGDKKDIILISIVGGLIISFLFILTTWFFSDWVLIFTGIHRYLTIPAIGASLFMGGIVTIIFNKLKTIKHTKFLSYTFLLVVIPIIIYNNAKVTADYFKHELEFAGTDATEHIRMKNKLRFYLNNFSETEPSVFYFDESEDYVNGYFDETTILAGFNYWMRFRGEHILPEHLTPKLIRSYYLCGGAGKVCPEKLKAALIEKDGVKGFLFGETFYKLKNFYGFKFKDRDLFDIRSETFKTLGLEPVSGDFTPSVIF